MSVESAVLRGKDSAVTKQSSDLAIRGESVRERPPKRVMECARRVSHALSAQEGDPRERSGAYFGPRASLTRSRDPGMGVANGRFCRPTQSTILGAMSKSETTERRFSPGARLRSFVYAGRGIRTMLVSQHNAWIHAIATVVVVSLGVILCIPRLEWLALILALVSVWTAEAINTAFEFLCDVASPEFHPLVEKAKDVAAGAVLVCALGAAIIGLLVFGPRLSALAD